MRSTSAAIASFALLLAACAPAASQDLINTVSTASSSTSNSSSAPTETVAVAERILSGGILEIGNADARTSMTLFINHGSDYSQQFNANLMPQLIHDFVSKGILRIGIVPLSLKEYTQSDVSASLLLCSAKQGKGRAMNALLFGDATQLQKQIGAIGLDITALQTCMKSDDLRTMIDAEAALATSYKITLVPSYMLGKRVFTGLPEYADLKGQVNAAIDGDLR